MTKALYIRDGLIPSGHLSGLDHPKGVVKNILSNMTPEQQRKTKRKFRKAKRKLIKLTETNIEQIKKKHGSVLIYKPIIDARSLRNHYYREAEKLINGKIKWKK